MIWNRWTKTSVLLIALFTLSLSYQNCEQVGSQFTHGAVDSSELDLERPDSGQGQSTLDKEPFSSEPLNSNAGNGGAFQGKSYILVASELCPDESPIDSRIITYQNEYLMTRQDCEAVEPTLIPEEEVEVVSETAIVYRDTEFIDEVTIDFDNLFVDEPLVPQQSLLSISGVSASGQYWPAANFIDGNASTAWNAGGYPPGWVQIDLGSTKTVTKIEAWIGGLLSCEIRVGPTSADTTIATIGEGYQVWTGNQSDVRYLMFYCFSGYTWVNASEVIVHGY